MHKMLGWLLLLGNGLLPLAAAHICDSQPFGTYLCDPASNGARYFICMGTLWPHQHLACPPGLVFDVQKTACDWQHSAQTCNSADQPSTTTTTTTSTTTSTTSAPTTSTTTTPHPTTTQPATVSTTTTTKTTVAPTADTPTTTTTTTKPTSSSTSTTSADIAHLCLGMPDHTYMCDPASNGVTFILCYGGRSFRKACPGGTFFDKRTKRCDWKANIQVMCVAGQTPLPPRSTTPAAPTTVTTTAPLPTGECNNQTCQLPDCRCVGSDIPGGLLPQEVPQMVVLTFDDRIGWDNFHYYPQLLWDRKGGALKNPNNCTTGATFFVSNDGNNMENVKKVWQQGHEIASHSQTHSNPAFWTPAKWTEEMRGMKDKLDAALGTTKASVVRGLRTPYLELGGDAQFSMMENNGFTYDSSFIVGSLNIQEAADPVWPFTLKYPPTGKSCAQDRCPQGSHPKVWEVPLIRQFNLQGEPCSMTDSCRLPKDATPANVTAYLRENFLRHYRGNRAPFMISLHTTWFTNVRSSLQGLKDFLAEINGAQYEHVWQVTVTQMLDWVRSPVPRSRLGELDSWKACGV